MPLTEDEPAVRLGDPFFVSFAPIFDIDNDQIGLGKSVNAPEGTSVTEWAELEEVNCEECKGEGIFDDVDIQKLMEQRFDVPYDIRDIAGIKFDN